MTPATYQLSTHKGLTLLRLRLLGVPQPNAFKHVGLQPRRGYKPDWNGHRGVDLTGRTFGRLKVIRLAPELDRSCGLTRWWCRCQCGNTTVVRRNRLTMGHTRSCGCLSREVAAATKRKHGHWAGAGFGPTPEYRSWACMLKRHRAITYRCWYRFEKFLADMGPKPPDTRLKRLRLYRGYRPGNVVWQ